MSYPLKQGLKHRKELLSTPLKLKVKVSYPLKQGLKQDSYYKGAACAPWVKVSYPLKQGLKLASCTSLDYLLYC